MRKRLSIVLMLTALVLNACKNSGHYEPLSNADTASTAQNADSTTSEIKLVKTAEMRFKVKNVQQSGTEIEALTKQYQGVVMHHETATENEQSQDIKLSSDSLMRVSAQNISAQMSVKVPSERLEEYMDQVEKMGIYVNLRRMNIEDKTFDYLSSKLKLQSRTQLIQQQKAGKVVIKSPADVLYLKDDMIDKKINNLKVNDEVKYSVVDLSFYQSNVIMKEIIANDNPSVYQLGFFNRLALAFENGWYLFKEAIVAIMNLWACILTGLVLWYMVKIYRKRKLVVQSV